MQIQLIPPNIIPFSNINADIYNKYIDEEKQG